MKKGYKLPRCDGPIDTSHPKEKIEDGQIVVHCNFCGEDRVVEEDDPSV